MIKMNYQLRKYNFFLVLCVTLLSGIGVFLIESANPAYQSRQMAGMVLGFCAMVSVSFVNYKWIVKTSWMTYALGLALLFFVTAAGAISGGAARWIEVGPLRFQPSELSKILFILFFSGFFADNRERMGELKFIAFSMAVLAVPAALILEQPDLSTAIILVWVILGMLFMAGLDYKIIGRALLGGIPCAAALVFAITRPGQRILSDYQYRRIMAWLSPGEWAQDSYQQRYSMMAIGSGGLMGKGVGNQSALSVKNGNFLPEPHTDFIMAVAGEELGFLGCCVILLLLALIVLSCIRTGVKSKNMAGRLICVGMAALIGGQAFVNLSVVSGMMPNTGLTLPFVSYGLTSMVSLYMGIGLVLNVGLHEE